MQFLTDYGGSYLGEYSDGADFDCFKRSGCLRSCCGLNPATTAMFEYLQRQINAVLSAAGSRYPLIAVDGALGQKTMAALVEANKFVAGTSEMGMAVGSQDYRLLAKYADSISSYLSQRAAELSRQRQTTIVTEPPFQPPVPMPPGYPADAPGPVPRPAPNGNGVVPAPRRRAGAVAAGVVAAVAGVGLVGAAIYYAAHR